ncbi:nitrate- and nitrite sensing domain-containing protein [Streptomyces sp. NPDC047928]|uniref:sensor histidine kinase n=1 Tax=unclassified Streptomyces TaxID=2593676 RepID=UPI003724B425
MPTPRTPQGAPPPPHPPAASARGRRAHAGRPAADEAPAGDHRRQPPHGDGPRPRSEPGNAGTERTGSARTGSVRTGSVRTGSVRTGSVRTGSVRYGGGRARTVRAKIISLLMVPVISLLALWGFATVTTAQEVARLRDAERVDDRVRAPVTAAVSALQAERRAAARQVTAPGTVHAGEFGQRARDTDAAVARLRLGEGHTVADTGDMPSEVASRLREFVTRAEGLTSVRTAITPASTADPDGRKPPKRTKADWDAVYDRYTTAISAGLGVHGALTGIQDVQGGARARVLLEFARAGEMLAREDTLLTSARLTGSFTAPRLRAFGGAAATRRTLVETATADLGTAERATWRRLTEQDAYRRITAAEDRIVTAPPGRAAATAVPAATWDQAHDTVRAAMTDLEADARRAAADHADPFTGGTLTPAGAAVLLGLVAVAASLVISVRIGRALVVELVSLRNTALEIARHKLPQAMRRLRAGEEIDIHAEAPPGPPAVDEIGQVGEALGTVHRAALSAAAERAELANGISGVFVNLARRSQVLVHRQLNLLDSMERRADDPGELGDLFRLDHLTTRMRRHAESLIILSGAAPGRAWRTPVPLTNVVRAAVSEIEDYARVEVRPLPEAAVVGAAVADLTHLLAELIENAAQFSPPHTKVRVSGEPVGNGYALEIEDRGLGMGTQALADANRRIEQSEALDLFDSDRLGLFVVSRLSARHDIKVLLRTSPYGGTTAVVLLPTALLQNALPAGAAPAVATRAAASAPGLTTRAEPAHGREHRPAAPAAAHANRAPLPHATHAPHDSAPDGRAPDAPARPQTSADRFQTPRGTAQPSARPVERPSERTVTRTADRTATRPDDRQPAGVTELRRRGRTPDSPPHPQAYTGDSGDGTAELPRRVRQASLVPQLRQAPEPPPFLAPADEEPAGRTPEQVRARMTAYRDGWRRGGGRAPGAGGPGATPSGSHHATPGTPSGTTIPGTEGDQG